MHAEHQRRVESLLENIRQLNKEMQLQELLIEHTIPPEFQDLIEKVTAASAEQLLMFKVLLPYS